MLVYVVLLLAACTEAARIDTAAYNTRGNPEVVHSLETMVLKVSDAVDCDCQVEMNVTAVISDVDGRAGLARPVAMTRTHDGKLAVVASVDRASILVFDARGVYQVSIGRRGGGPGEYNSITALESGRADSIVVLDSGRLTLLGPDFEYARSVSIPWPVGFMKTFPTGDVVLLSAISPGSETAPDRLHLLAPSFAHVRSFMPEAPRASNGDPASARRRIAGSNDGIVWVAHTADYVIEKWNLEGELLGRLMRQPDWFESAEAEAPGGKPVIEMLHVDGSERLWVVAYAPALHPRAAPSSGVPITPFGMMRGTPPAFDSIIEVIDLKRNQLLASVRVNAQILFMLGDGIAASYRENESGQPAIDIWEMKVISN